MASIERRPNGRYRARYRDIAGKEHARHFLRKADAQLWLDSITTSTHTGAYVDPKRMRLTVGEWAGQWLATKIDLKATTRRGYESALRAHVFPEWGSVRLGDVTYQAIAAWVARLHGSGLSPASVQHHHRVLSLILASAVRDGRLARNAAVGVPLPRRVRGEQTFLTHDRSIIWPRPPDPTGWRSFSSPTPESGTARWPPSGCAISTCCAGGR